MEGGAIEVGFETERLDKRRVLSAAATYSSFEEDRDRGEIGDCGTQDVSSFFLLFLFLMPKHYPK
jgi:hypothetical protein